MFDLDVLILPKNRLLEKAAEVGSPYATMLEPLSRDKMNIFIYQILLKKQVFDCKAIICSVKECKYL